MEKPPGLGVDIIETARFKNLLQGPKQHQLKKFFSEKEILYCKSFKEPWVNFAGHFAAKEAVAKALGLGFIELEIRHNKNGSPSVWRKNKKLNIRVSISHIKTLAVAVAVK